MRIFRRHRKYYISYYFRGRRKREMVGPSKGAAKQALSIRLAEIAQAKFKIMPMRGAMTFDRLGDKYRDLISIHKRGHHVEKYILKSLAAFFGDLRVFDLSAEDAERFKAARSKSVKHATANRELTVAKHMLTKAVEWKLIPDNPFRTVRSMSVPRCPERVLDYTEETKLLAACTQVRSRFLQRLVLLALHTGMRRGELLSLEWSRVDFDQRTIRVINAESSAGDRLIPMNATVHTLLSDLVKKASSPLVFPSNRRRGKKLLDLEKGFKKAVQLSGIAHFRWHDMRHTFATRLVRAGVDIVSVQHLLGHSKITMTARYAHSLADAKIAAVSMLDLAGVCSSLDSNRTPAPIPLEPKASLNGSAV